MPTKRKCRLFRVDAFTRTLFEGNPAVVVLDAEQLSGDEMAQIARELTGADVAFLIKSDTPEYDVELRFFSPRREVTCAFRLDHRVAPFAAVEPEWRECRRFGRLRGRQSACLLRRRRSERLSAPVATGAPDPRRNSP